MRIDVRLDGSLRQAGAEAAAAEHAGFDAVWVAEAGNDPFLALALAAERTSRIELGSGVAIAFARNPMTVATTAWDLNRLAEGRLLLGLGSQVRAHVERRYSMPWSHPAARMREFVQAMRAIWAAWDEGAPLDFRGDFYTHTLMPPVFVPAPSRWGAPRIYLAAVGPRMTEVAGEVADGIRIHGFTTERYLREVTLPALGRGLALRARNRAEVSVSYPVLFATGLDSGQLAATIAATRRQLAFYGATPAYRGVLDMHGRGDLHERLHALSLRGEWLAMADLVDDEMLDALAVVGEPDAVAAAIVARYGALVDRVSLHQPYGAPPDVDLVRPVATRVAALVGSRSIES